MTVYAYYCLPYAEPPICNLRFQRLNSLKLSSWIKKYKNNAMCSKCYQDYDPKSGNPFQVNGPYSENCLFLNVWTPRIKSCSKLPVMVWFHGGGAIYGAITMPEFEGRALAGIGGVVVVTVNYRLNVFGFLYGNNSQLPGDQGLYDQRLALQWIKDYIHYFGGDPNTVTIFGESAGGLSVGMHLLTPESRGLFKRAITQSGVPFIRKFGIKNSMSALNFAQRLAKRLGCISYNSEIEMNCMKSLSPETLLEAYNTQTKIDGIITMNYGNEFLKINPNVAFINHSIVNTQLFVGVNANEGLLNLMLKFPNQFPRKNKPNINKTVIIELTKQRINTVFGQMSKSDFSHVMQYYYNINECDYDRLRQTFIDLESDMYVVCPSVFFAGNAVKYGRNTPYFYFFNQNTSYNKYGKFDSSTHYQEIQYMFGMPFLHPEVYNDEERALSKDMIQIWTSFAKYGVPSSHRLIQNGIRWPQFKKMNGQYVTLNSSPEYYIKSHIRDNACKMWTHLRFKYIN